MLNSRKFVASLHRGPSNERLMQQIANWILVPVPAAAAYFLNDLSNWWIFAVVCLCLGALVKITDYFSSAMRDYVISFCFIGHCIMLTSAFAGHPWQIDSHMLFFAALAIVSTLGSPRALIFATVLVALHHLSLSFLLPKLVYPSGGLAENLQRTIMHAMIVLLESGVLLLSLLKRSAAEAALNDERFALQEQTEVANKSRAATKKSQEDAEFVVTTLQKHLDDLSSGQLDCPIDTEFPSGYAQLRQSFNTTVTKLGETIGQVSTAAGDIKTNASGMSASSEDLSKRSENQAATLKETATALENLTSSIRQATEGAQNTKSIAMNTRKEAEESGQIVEQAVAAMKTIENSSEQISNIIGVIDDIAFQTNLLALNAGVEAARAGEAGRGFAVVASEVRGLAHRSAESATEIKVLIQQSSGQVRNGVEFVDKAGTAISEIVGRVNEITTAISSIASSLEKQSLGLSEINVGVSELDTVTQRNATMASALNSSGYELNDCAEKLSVLMQQFQLKLKAEATSRVAA